MEWATPGGTHALVVGDAVWDMESAGKAGHSAVGLLSGGIARQELLDAVAIVPGAVDVQLLAQIAGSDLSHLDECLAGLLLELPCGDQLGEHPRERIDLVAA